MVEKDKKVLCPICGGPIKLEMYGSTSYFQCEKNFTHRISLPEYSDMIQGDRSEDEIRQSMEERAQNLMRQKNIKDQIKKLQSDLEMLQTELIS
jgi:uncharacterized Zn finger protein (UPF0148 family)